MHGPGALWSPAGWGMRWRRRRRGARRDRRASEDAYLDPPVFDLDRVGTELDAGIVEAATRAKVEVLLVDGRRHLDDVSFAPDDAAREDERFAERVVVADGEEFVARGDAEDGNLFAPHERAYAAPRLQALVIADVYPVTAFFRCLHVHDSRLLMKRRLQ